MELQEALNLIAKACEAVHTDLAGHMKLQEAIKVVVDKLNEKKDVLVEVVE